MTEAEVEDLVLKLNQIEVRSSVGLRQTARIGC
jgi:hypothetical protein